MRYRVEVAEPAKSDLFDIYRWIAADSALNAARFIAGIEEAIFGLAVSPERCPVSPEDEEFEDTEIRHLVVGVYRTLFTVRGDTVFVLHIRHGRRQSASRAEIARTLRESLRHAVMRRDERSPDP